METRRIDVGDNERQYPTDCVSTVSRNGDLLYIALNKRNKASEPYSCEIHAYDLTSNLEIGFVCKQATTCRFIAEATGDFVAVFMLKYALILERETLEPAQKLPYKRSGLFGVIQGGSLAYEPSEVILSFFEPMDKISRIYFVKFVQRTN